jgi:phytanoyl-CoA hydroxylase
MPRRLSEDQLRRFAEDGYLIVRSVLGDEEIATLRDTFTEVGSHGPIQGLSDIGRFADDDPLAKWPRMMHPHRHPELPIGPLSMRYMLDARLGDILTDLLGEPPLAAQSMFYFKPPGARGQDLHQDNFYLRIQPGTCMAAWVAVDDADADNGGMVVVPGSHRMDVVCPEAADPATSFTTAHVEPPEGMSPVPADMKAGDVLFFGGSVIHGSYPNTSGDRFRRAFICHYAPASCTQVGKHYFPLYDFDGQIVERQEATGGGPCGQLQEAITSPH